MKIPIHKTEVIRIPTLDVYNKADYKWDPQLKKTVYIGHKKKKKEEITEPEKKIKIEAKKTKKSVKTNIKKTTNKNTQETTYKKITEKKLVEMTNEIGRVVEKGNQAEKEKAIDNYTHRGYSHINKCLRDNDYASLDANDVKTVKALRKITNEFKLDENIIVYRGQKELFQLKDYNKDNLQSNVGKIITFDNFVSTSTSDTTAMEFLTMGSDGWKRDPIIMTLKLNKEKTKGAFLNGYSHYMTESEFLVQDKQSFKITAIKTKKDPLEIYSYTEIELSNENL